ncbi:MAG: serine/threonine protein kinase, partial [Planctomycetaceae bacterium]
MPADPKLSLREDRPETTEAELLARVRFEFGELLKITPPVRLENYLSNLPAPQRLVALPTLLELDLAWAYDWGQPRPSCDDYVARLPEFKEAVRSFFAQLDSRKGLDDHEDTGELPPPAETLRWRRGLRLGSYELLDALGQGGFGEVWKGRNHNDGSLVAIKSVGPTRRKGSLKSLETITKHNNSLAREREILRELSELDLRVPKLLDEGQDGSGRPYIVMELVPGHDLQHQRERGDWSWRRCVLVTLSIAEALRDLHMQGYYHCDLKTRNIMLDAEDRAWLIDMGSTMRYDDVVQQGIGYYPPFTHGYAPPEAEASDDATQITARYDLHMLGAVLYVLLTGRPPGPDETRLRDKYNDHREQLAPQPPSEIHPRLPGVIDDVCLWMLKKSSQSRPRNAQEVIDRLERALEEDSAEAGWSRGDLPGGSVNDPQIATHAGHASSTAKEPASSDSQPVGLLDVPRAPAIPPPAPPAGGGPRRLALAGAGGTLSVLLALALSIGGRETDPARAAASAGHTVLFELGPMVASVQGQFAPPSLKRTDLEVFEAQAGYPYQVMVGTATETERKYAI